MTRALASKVAEQRAMRDAARGHFDARLEQVRQDLEARGIAGRLADKASEEARDAIDEALAVAAESKGIIAGTIAALAIWFLRNPILARIEAMLDADGKTEGN